MDKKLTEWDRKKLAALSELLTPDSQPNLNALAELAGNINLVSLNIKVLGYELARQLATTLQPYEGNFAHTIGLFSKASTQSDLETAWVKHWCTELKVPVILHRKTWELAFVLQAIYEEGHLRDGARGLGFGCGVEPIPSYLASHGVTITVTDLPADEAIAMGWAQTDQHIESLEQAFHSHLVERDRFDSHVDIRVVDMNAIPADLVDYDFCWSVCALEHVGSIVEGLSFVENSLETLRPGGLSVHTTEFNINPEGPTIDNWPTVLFQRKHFESLAEDLRAKGHWVAPFNWDLGAKPLDRFVDLPPFSHNLPAELNEWLGPPNHLKVGVDGFVATCFGIVVRKAG